MTHSLTLGSLLLTDDMPEEGHGYVFSVLAEGASFGVAQGVQEVVRSLLADGDLVRTTRYGNRQVSFRIQVTGPSLAAVAQGEAALRREVGIGNTLTWQAPDIFAVPTVFEVVDSEMSPSFDDLGELNRSRIFTVTLTCSPFARSAELTTVPAVLVDGTPVTQVVTAADTTTGWTATVFDGVTSTPVAVTDQGDFVRASGTGIALNMSHALAAPVSMAGTPYLIVELSGEIPQSFQVGVQPNLTRMKYPVRIVALTGGRRLYALDVGSETVTRIAATFASQTPRVMAAAFHEVTRSNMLPDVSPRQVARIVDVGGTERTPASLHAYTSSGYLGRTIVHTTPADESGYTPDLTRWNYSGSDTSPNSGERFITGSWEALQPSPLIARRSADSVPRGDYILMAAMKSSTAGLRAVSYAVKSILAGSTVVGNMTGTAYFNFEVADRMEFVPIAAVSAPVVRSEGTLDVEIHLSNPSPGATSLFVEEWWLFTDGPDSALSIVGTDEAEMWLESADISSPVPRVWVGNSNGRFHPNTRLIAQGTHTFRPGLMQVTTISDANDYLEADLSYYKRWHSNAAE